MVGGLPSCNVTIPTGLKFRHFYVMDVHVSAVTVNYILPCKVPAQDHVFPVSQAGLPSIVAFPFTYFPALMPEFGDLEDSDTTKCARVRRPLYSGPRNIGSHAVNHHN